MIYALAVQRPYKSVSVHTKMKHKILYGGNYGLFNRESTSLKVI